MFSIFKLFNNMLSKANETAPHPCLPGKHPYWKGMWSRLRGIGLSPADGATVISEATQKAANSLLEKSGAFHGQGKRKLEIALLVGAALSGAALYYLINNMQQTWIIGVLIGMSFIYGFSRR